MKKQVKGTTLVITDPCYIRKSPNAHPYINQDTIYGDWSCFCYKCNQEEAKEKVEEWDEFYFDFYRKYNFSSLYDGEKQKLYDDFHQKKKDFIEENCYGEFAADSGKVAVFDFDALSEEDQKWVNEHDWCACIIPDYTGEFKYVIEGEGSERSAHIVGEGFYTSQSGL